MNVTQHLCFVAVSPASLLECQKGALRQEYNRKTITFTGTGCPIVHDLLLSVLDVKKMGMFQELTKETKEFKRGEKIR